MIGRRGRGGGRGPLPRPDSPRFWPLAEELAVAAVAGDRRATERLIELVRPWILRLIGRQLPYRGDAEDVAQEVSLTIFRRITGLREPGRIRPWLAAVTFNQVRSFYRRKRVEGDDLRRAVADGRLTGVALERTSVLGGFRVDLLDGLDRLPPGQALALVLRLAGVPYEELAAELSHPDHRALLPADRPDGPVPVGTAKRWVSEARRALERSLGATDPDPDPGPGP